MITTNHVNYDPHTQDRLLIVGAKWAPVGLVDQVQRRLSNWSVSISDTYLKGIAEVARQPVQAVLVYVEPSQAQLSNAVTGLRDAAGCEAKVVLCCRVPAEPAARQAMTGGADDYLLFPFFGAELEQALGIESDCGEATGDMTIPTTNSIVEPLMHLADLFANLSDSPKSLLNQAAGLVKEALGATGVMLVVDGAMATAGEAVTKPVLSVPLNHGDEAGPMGQIALSARIDGAYTPDDMEALTQYARIIRQVIATASQQRHWQRLAVTDQCSGLPNRRYLYERLDAILLEATTKRFPVTVLLFDVDDFKGYNDKFGHDAGDTVIKIVGELFRKNSRDQDIVTRYGGDEFAVVFWDADGSREAGSSQLQHAHAVLDRFKESLRNVDIPNVTEKGGGKITISGGLATYPWDGNTRVELLKKADDALLAAKRAGKNRVFVIGQSDDKATT